MRTARAWYGAWVAPLVADVGIGMTDVAIEPASRKRRGRLPGRLASA
jgi:hypothetical protein